MKQITRFIISFLLFATGLQTIVAQTFNVRSLIPLDEDVRIGRLPNGLTYYIQHNNRPEIQADFYLAQRVGSINEEESQRGLAHFLEHMCFNGTVHFPGNSLIRYLETLGVRFGENLNAYTAVDETVYNIDNVPTTRISALDSCLLILRDWSHDLTLSPKEIDKERGVIQGEWRMRTGAQYRMLEKCAPVLFPQSRYGRHLPIGLMDVVQHFKYQELRNYYQKWYRPDLQVVIVVGNVDVCRTERKIKELFGSVKLPVHPERHYRERDKEETSAYVASYVRHFLDNEPIASTATYYAIMKEMLPGLSAEDVTRMYRGMVSRSDTNVVILTLCPDKKGEAVPSKAALVKAFRAARADKLTPYIDKVKEEPLIQREPLAGRIVKETVLPKWNVKLWILSNGIKVYLKKTDFEKEQVYIRGQGGGGTSVFGTSDVPDVRLMNQVMNITGVGNFTVSELKKKLAGKDVAVVSSVGNNEASLFASSTPRDLKTAFQLLYLNATAPKRDDEAFRSLINVMESSLVNAGVSPMRALADSIYQTSYARHPLAAMIDTGMVKAVNYERVLAMYRQVFRNFSGFNFVIVGHYDEDSVRSLTERYIASLPAFSVPDRPVDTGFSFVKGRVRNEFYREMETPQAVDFVTWEQTCPYNLKNCMMADMISQALQMTYLKQIREDRGWAYSLTVSGEVNALDLGPGHQGSVLFTVRCPVKPENGLDALKIIHAEMEAIAERGIDASVLSKIKAYLIKTARDNATDNDYWRGIISKYAVYGVDFDTEYIPLVQRITSGQLKDFARRYVLSGNSVEVIMHPVVR